MGETALSQSPRRKELLERAYHYALEHGLTDMSLRPLAAAIGSSPRVLLFLFGSKDGLVRALLARARADELAFLAQARAAGQADLAAMVRATWQWLAAKPVRPLLTLWTEAYARSLAEPGGPWSGFARQTVEDWLAVLAAAQPTGRRSGTAISAEHTLALAVLRGGLLDLLATGDTDRVTAAIQHYLRLTSMDGKGDDATPPTLPDATGDGGTVLGALCGLIYARSRSARPVRSRAWAAMVAAVRASRPQNVRAPWSATSMMIGVDPDKASHTAAASGPGHQPERRADLGVFPLLFAAHGLGLAAIGLIKGAYPLLWGAGSRSPADCPTPSAASRS